MGGAKGWCHRLSLTKAESGKMQETVSRRVRLEEERGQGGKDISLRLASHPVMGLTHQ